MAQNLTNEKLEKQHSVRRIPRHVAVKLAQCFTAYFPAQRCSWFSHGHVTIQLIDCVLSLTDNTVIMYGSPEGTWCDNLIIRPDELIIRPDELIIRPDELLNCHTMSLRGFRT